MKTLQKIWEYFFFPWEVTVLEEDKEIWTYINYLWSDEERKFCRYFVKYLYVHKFRKQSKIVKKYLN